MKKIYFLISLLTIISLGLSETRAQVPQSFLYQAEARDSKGKVLVEESLSVKVTINQNSTEIYQEIHDVMTDMNGLFNLRIGEGDIIEDGDFSTIVWDNGTYYLNIQISIGASNNYTDMGTTQLLSVPYALHAETVSNADDADADPLNELNTNVSLNGTNLEVTDAGGTKSADLSTLVNLTSCDIVLDILLHTEDLETLINAGVPLEVLNNAGYGVGVLRRNGVSEQDLINAGLTGFVSDEDGNNYKWVRIGGQVWMAENLAYDADDGSMVYDDDESNLAIYGRLYIWDVVMQGESGSESNPSGVQGICPCGWHVPSEAEWMELRNHLISNGYSYEAAGNALKATSGWDNDANGSDDYGFSAVPGGRYVNWPSESGYRDIGSWAFWWTTDEINQGTGVWGFTLGYLGQTYVGNTLKTDAIYVRCVRD
ncbi:hypothetical protein OU798_08865 [Prolixibacteraceae bacterium Z1-6]|uniref:Fibrobacter succinogenes major paralogous domain-containing protein n=1 Tax=Draconibacterium aestuarii TaxID=2998507 RepID=A0A9X3J4J1_9BACT|nr:hypothetical protein [Prolixibacteraceae bacterium Z1-6]